jgi:membrane-associated protein
MEVPAPVDTTTFLDWFVHIDAHLAWFFQTYGFWAFAILFLVIFGETGFVVLPFLPGDSLLFAAGALSASMGLSLPALLIVVPVAAILGNTVNYWIGRRIGQAALREGGWLHKYIKPHHLARAHSFFAKWGGWAITLCRFIPILRTITPFVAGLGRMNFAAFTWYNILGSVVWGIFFIMAGFLFGNLPIVKDNFHILVSFILFISTVPFIAAIIKARLTPRKKDGGQVGPEESDSSGAGQA